MKALSFGEKTALVVPDVDDFEADKPFSIAAWVYMPKNDENYVVASRLDPKPEKEKDEQDKKETEEEEKDRGWTIEINGRVPSFLLSTQRGSIQVRGSNVQRLRPGTWTHLTFIYDGSRDQTGLSMYVNGQNVANEGRGDSVNELKGSLRATSPLRLGAGGKNFFPGGAVADFRIYRRTLRQEESQILASWSQIRTGLAQPNSSLAAEQRNALRLFYLNRHDAAYRELEDRLDALEKERRAIRRRSAITHVMEEKAGSMPVAEVLFRGQYDQPRGEVSPDVPGVLPRLPESAPRNRLGLAQWLVDRQQSADRARDGQSILAGDLRHGTRQNHGRRRIAGRGALPSGTPRLAGRRVPGVRLGHRRNCFELMVTSAAYRQSALSTEDKLRKDPDNRLLSRGPRFRMDAEMVRDIALASSGLLVPTIGGPSVKPYQPDGLWETVAMKGSNTRFYKQDHGDKLFRRSLYTFWKRSAPPASHGDFQCPHARELRRPPRTHQHAPAGSGDDERRPVR